MRSCFALSNMFRIFNQYVSGKSLLLIFIETFIIALSLVFAAELRFWNRPTEFAAYVIYPDFALQIAIIVLVCLLCFYCNDLYDPNARFTRTERILRLEQSLGAATLLLALLYFLAPELMPSRGVFLIGMLLVTTLIAIGRRAVDSFWQWTAPLQRVAILGTGQMAINLARELTSRGDLNMKLEGFVSTTCPVPSDTVLFGAPVLGAAAEIETIASRRNLGKIIVALEDRRGVLPTRELVTLRVRGVKVEEAGSTLAALTGRVSLRAIKPSWFVFSEGFRRSAVQAFIKRVFDLVFATTGFVLSLPIMLIVAVAVKLDSRGPVIYRQLRVGRMNRTFNVLKFRSMREDAENGKGAQWASLDDPRVTRIGRFLRHYRLDELPQFINVLRGEMSFVGPRPERPVFVEQLRQTIPYYDERHSARPGLTGWAQVKYPYGSTVEDAFNKLEYDLFYLKNMSLTFDLAIIFQTIRIVIGGHGAR